MGASPTSQIGHPAFKTNTIVPLPPILMLPLGPLVVDQNFTGKGGGLDLTCSLTALIIRILIDIRCLR